MMEIVVQALLWISGIFAVLGAIGLFRFPDFYTRTHAATVVSVGGATLPLIALMLSTWFGVFTVKILIIVLANMVVGSVGTHALALAAYNTGLKPKVVKDELRGSK
jgi:multicomponent Na+:H+ antiporter subunit G